MDTMTRTQYGQSQGRSEACGRNFNLAELRDMGAAVLDIVGVEGLAAIILRELEVFWENAWQEVTRWRGADLFKGAVRCGRRSPYPSTGNLRIAGFDVYSCGDREPVRVVIPGRGPVRVSSPGHPDVIGRWLEKMRKEAARGLSLCLFAFMVIGSGAAEVLDQDGSDDDEEGERHGLVERPRDVGKIRNPKHEIRPAATARQRGENKFEIRMPNRRYSGFVPVQNPENAGTLAGILMAGN